MEALYSVYSTTKAFQRLVIFIWKHYIQYTVPLRHFKGWLSLYGSIIFSIQYHYGISKVGYLYMEALYSVYSTTTAFQRLVIFIWKHYIQYTVPLRHFKGWLSLYGSNVFSIQYHYGMLSLYGSIFLITIPVQCTITSLRHNCCYR